MSIHVLLSHLGKLCNSYCMFCIVSRLIFLSSSSPFVSFLVVLVPFLFFFVLFPCSAIPMESCDSCFLGHFISLDHFFIHFFIHFDLPLYLVSSFLLPTSNNVYVFFLCFSYYYFLFLRLMGMTELEREEIIFDRYERREKLRADWERRRAMWERKRAASNEISLFSSFTETIL